MYSKCFKIRTAVIMGHGSVIFHLWCLFLGATADNDTGKTHTMTDVIDTVFKDYDQKLPPKHDIHIREGNEQRVDVEVDLYVVSIFAISEIDMDYSMSLYLRERWNDPRLEYNNTLNLSRLVLEPAMLQKIWLPDMFVSNEKKSEFHDVTVPNRYIHIYPDGTVQLSMRITGTFFCHMLLHKFPFDSQECYFVLESYGHSTEFLRFRWVDSPLVIEDDIQFARFILTKAHPYTCYKVYDDIEYPCIGVKFLLQRNYAYYIIQVYVPSMLIVLLSWVNFWLDQNAVPARITLALLTVLTLTTQSTGARANLPPVSYVKAIDVWMAVCLTFVFMALIEFALVNVHSRRSTRRLSHFPDTCNKDSIELSNESEEGSTKTDKECGACWNFNMPSEVARTIDKTSRWLFPLVFLFFNVFYWLYYFL